jgi:hypothetical protein
MVEAEAWIEHFTASAEKICARPLSLARPASVSLSREGRGVMRKGAEKSSEEFI